MVIRWLTLLLFTFLSVELDQKPKDLQRKYELALSYYNASEPTAYTDSLAIKLFEELLSPSYSRYLGGNKLLDIFEKLGNLELIAKNPQKAISYYREGLNLRDNSSINDSLFFSSNLFLGESYYLLNKPDSSKFFFQEAEKVLLEKNSDEEASRLFNSLGVIYFETGNYDQAINYFKQARNLVVKNADFDKLDSFSKYANFSFLNNIGSSLIQLNQLDSALQVYRELEGYQINKDQVNNQIASIFLDLEQPDSALYYLNQIISNDYRESFSFHNQLADIHFQKKELDQAEKVLTTFISSFDSDKQTSSFKLGRSFSLLGKVAFEKGEYEKAVLHFHSSIKYIDGLFDQDDIFQNPSDYTLGFATFSLIESMVNKSKSLLKLFEINQQEKYFEASISTFQTAFDMAYFVANFYDNDKARIFLGDFILPTYQEAVEVLLRNYQNTGDEKELHLALEWAERSKSTSLTIGLKEKRLKKIAGIAQEKLEQEKNLQFSISKLQQAIIIENEQEKIDQLQTELTNKRLLLSRLHDEFNQSAEYVQQKLLYGGIDFKKIQNQLQNDQSAILSFFEGAENLHLFLIDDKNISLHKIAKLNDLNEEIAQFKKNIIQYSLGQKYQRGGIGSSIFNQIFGGFHSKLGKYSNLLIIPHGNLVDLPFEVLEKPNGSFFLDEHAITYQFTLTQLGLNSKFNLKDAKSAGFAPFYEHSWYENGLDFPKLPYSKEEIRFLKGASFVGEEAKKEALIRNLSDVGFLQLSTHAIPDPENPDLAFIAMYPGDPENRLYTNEVVLMDLSHTALVFLSACETNFGSSSKSEGLLSITRAFMLAGCQNIISSLWKAEDKATAYITRLFYQNLEQGDGFAKALQKAKLTMLADPKMAQYHHPVFWAHLVLVGDFPEYEKSNGINFFLFSALLLLFVYGAIHYFRKISSK